MIILIFIFTLLKNILKINSLKTFGTFGTSSSVEWQLWSLLMMGVHYKRRDTNKCMNYVLQCVSSNTRDVREVYIY